MADMWWTSLVSGFVGAIAGAVSTRQLADRSDRRKQLYDAYSKWVVAATNCDGGSMDSASNEAMYRGLWSARWALELLEPDPERRKEVAEITGHLMRGDFWKVGDRLGVFINAVRRLFAEQDI